ncbi:hypothetical protein QQX98_012163 [Neonectria punicea]|uniref:Major facilitator superfamily (MFS) profile domain-containing protein n=1 Tax=Neonectria punicea TaxID=979145 RepID=A0ABR1GJS9_9HYPO
MDENLDETAIHEIEDELNTKIYPGTEIMRDVGSHHFFKAGEARVLVPQPSNDEHDPLNWNAKWKTITVVCGCLLSFSLNLGPLANAPLFGIAILVLGFSNFIWVPMSTCFGRRPVMILSSLVCAISSIWRARATSYGSFMGASVLNGLGAGPCETVMPQIIADMIFLHDRGKYQTLYFTTYFSSLMIGPIIAGAMAEHHGWRSFWWWNTALLFFTCAVNTFFFPETRYKRDMPATPDHQRTGDGIEKQRSNDGTASTREVERGAPVIAPSEEQDTWLSRGKPSKKQFLPWGSYQGSILRELWLPWYLHLYPIVEFASFAVSFAASGFLLANLTQQQALSPPPYNFAPQSVGFTNFAILAGGLVGLFTSGPLSDWVSERLTRRNNGVREPEMRLVTMVPYVLVMILGSVVVAVGYDRHWPWEAIVVLGYTCLGIQVTSLPSIASTYAIDSYKPITGSMFVTITINKNVWGYGFSKYITSWAEKDGFVPPMLTTMALIVFFCSFGIVFWYFGKRFRGWTKDSFVHRL